MSTVIDNAGNVYSAMGNSMHTVSDLKPYNSAIESIFYTVW